MRSLRVVALSLLLCAAHGAAAQALVNGMNLVGSAAAVGSAGGIRLTPLSTSGVGAAWKPVAQVVTGGFVLDFTFQITVPGNHGLAGGGDGFAVVLQGVGPKALGNGGCEVGYGGLSPSVEIEFDTFRNDYYCAQIGDPSDNEIGLHAAGNPVETAGWYNDLNAGNTGLVLKDGKTHAARIQYVPATKTATGQLTVYVSPTGTLDTSDAKQKILDLPFDLSQALPTGNAWIGFTSSSASAWEAHDVLSWALSGTRDAPSIGGTVKALDARGWNLVGAAGVGLTLTDKTTQQNATAVTGDDGTFSFDALVVGHAYTVAPVVAAPMTLVQPASRTTSKLTAGQHQNMTFTATYETFGVNGTIHSGCTPDSLLKNVTVDLLDDAGHVWHHATSDANGAYAFTGLEANHSYVLIVDGADENHVLSSPPEILVDRSFTGSADFSGSNAGVHRVACRLWSLIQQGALLMRPGNAAAERSRRLLEEIFLPDPLPAPSPVTPSTYTQATWKDFQWEHDAYQTGQLDQPEMVSLLDSPGTPLHIDAQTPNATDQVRVLQEQLVALGYSTMYGFAIPTSGAFDDVTERALRTFQQDHDLFPSGVLTAETQSALDRATPGVIPGLSGLPASAMQAIHLFKSEFGYTTFNPERVAGYDDCGPSSLAAVLASVGFRRTGTDGGQPVQLTNQEQIWAARALIRAADGTVLDKLREGIKWAAGLSDGDLLDSGLRHARMTDLIERGITAASLMAAINEALRPNVTPRTSSQAQDALTKLEREWSAVVYTISKTTSSGAVINYPETLMVRHGVVLYDESEQTLGVNQRNLANPGGDVPLGQGLGVEDGVWHAARALEAATDGNLSLVIEDGSTWDELRSALRSGAPVIAYGTATTTVSPSWSHYFPVWEAGNSNYGGLVGGSTGHIISIVGLIPDPGGDASKDRFIVLDPLYASGVGSSPALNQNGGPVEMPQDALAHFFAPDNWAKAYDPFKTLPDGNPAFSIVRLAPRY